jgi:hypothetical protein
MLTHSEDDAHIVETQLGRPLRGRWAVARRCHLDLPMVVENHPRLDDGSPFPTLFWLTCPLLHRRVSRLEGGGGMAAMTRRLAVDDDLRARLEDSLIRYRARRDDHEVVEDSGAPPGGGPRRVKCLHAHTAHELADPPNPAGAIALAVAGFPDCALPCVMFERAPR